MPEKVNCSAAEAAADEILRISSASPSRGGVFLFALSSLFLVSSAMLAYN